MNPLFGMPTFKDHAAGKGIALKTGGSNTWPTLTHN